MKNFWYSFFAVLFFCFSTYALSPEKRLDDEVQEQRAMNLFLQVRCLVCNGQVIENSDTEFAFQMRKIIREKIVTGKSDEEIKEELIRKFGKDILTDPKSNILLWILPLIFVVVGIRLILRGIKRI